MAMNYLTCWWFYSIDDSIGNGRGFTAGAYLAGAKKLNYVGGKGVSSIEIEAFNQQIP